MEVVKGIETEEKGKQRQLYAEEAIQVLSKQGVVMPLEKIEEDGQIKYRLTKEKFDEKRVEEMIAENEAKRNAVLEARSEGRKETSEPYVKKANGLDYS